MPSHRSWCRVRINTAGYYVSGSATSHVFRPLPDYDLWFAWTGQGQMIGDRESFSLNSGTIMCLRHRHQYETRFNPESPLGHCFIHFDFLSDAGDVVHPAEQDLPPHCSRTSEIEFTYLTMRRIADLARAGDPTLQNEAECYLQGLLLSLLHANTMRDASPTELEHRQRIAELVHHVREDPSRGFSVAEIAARGNYSPDYFAKVFKRIHGTTPTKFFIGIRLERACALLSETTLGVEQIADVLGYADIYFFSRQFKQNFGTSPTRWRRNDADAGSGSCCRSIQPRSCSR